MSMSRLTSVSRLPLVLGDCNACLAVAVTFSIVNLGRPIILPIVWTFLALR